MNTYIVGIASTFKGTVKLIKVKAHSPNDAKLEALKSEGWDVSSLEAAAQIEDWVSDPMEINE